MAGRWGDLQKPDALKSTMHSLAYGQAMLAAAKDYMQEVGAANAAASSSARCVHVDELLDDPELQALHAERLAELQKENERRAVLQRKGQGELQEVTEGEFLEAVTTGPRVVCHFFHRDFERCRVVDTHMRLLARKYTNTRFIRLSAPDAPFFTAKLAVKVLPALLCFADGLCVDRAVGFADFGSRDDFPTSAVERRLARSGALAAVQSGSDSDSEVNRAPARSLRRGALPARACQRRTASDEDSEFED